MKSSQSLLTLAPLNTIGDNLRAKSRSASDGRLLRENLAEFLRITQPPKPRGQFGKRYRLSSVPSPGMFHRKSRERLLEADLFRLHRDNSPPFFEGKSVSAARVVSFQTPLYSKRKKAGWGSVDLLAVDDTTQQPIVVELKIAKASIEPPLRAAVEALSYMIALRANWDDFVEEWTEQLRACGIAVERPIRRPARLTAIVLAPHTYWEVVRGDKHLCEAIDALDELVEDLRHEKHGYEVLFATTPADWDERSSSWRVTAPPTELAWPLRQSLKASARLA